MGYVIEGLIGEQEFLYMSKETMEALSHLIDDYLGEMILAYVNKPDANTEVVSRILEELGDALYTATFNVDIDSDLATVCKTSTELMGDIDIDRTATIEKLRWLSGNKMFLRPFLPPRSKADFDTFMKGLSMIEYPDGVSPSPRLLSTMKNNSMLFYKRNEKPRNTGLGYLSTRADDWEMKLEALMFSVYKSRHKGIEYLLRDY